MVLLLTGLCVGLTASAATVKQQAEQEDPFLWLEDVEGSEALRWVRDRNAESQKMLEGDLSFASLKSDLLAIRESEDRIPNVEKHGDHYYNFWRDKQHTRGLWRRTTPDEYAKPSPRWDTLLDLDALNKAEGESWVWNGYDCLRPKDKGAPFKRCLVDLSRGGADASVSREFDLSTKQFVKDGFVRPESKGGLAWVDENTVHVFTDFGEGSLTSSGYPRMVKEWKRGMAMEQAKLVYEAGVDDMVAFAEHQDTPGFERNVITRHLTIFDTELHVKLGDRIVKIDAPDSAKKSLHRGWLVIELRDASTFGGKRYAAGSLLVAKFDAYMAGSRDMQVLFEPDARTSLNEFGVTPDYFFINVLEDVKSRIYMIKAGSGEWSREPLPGVPDVGAASLSAVDAGESNDYFLTVNDYIAPTKLLFGTFGGGNPTLLKQLPQLFDATGLEQVQHFATSKDGTKIPYFMVGKKDLRTDGTNPTLLEGYGGFEISYTPEYSPGLGRAWLMEGGVYVVANIRGGGEYGPGWHQAAVKANRMRAYEDFAAVAEDLIARKITSPKHLGIQGASNGGLLMGNMTVLYPQLFGAVVCQVPLLDMKRYHKLLAGASWMAEYGDPDKPEEWEFIKEFSPYQNVKAEVDYPPVLFTTSTRDDRVHPGHARKMMAKMKEQEHEVVYYENIEGGHGGAADNKQSAHMQALAYTFLKQKLFAKD